MPFVLISHRVKDFQKWKAAYDSHLAARQTAGLTEKYLLRNANDSNEVVLLFEASDLEKARDFVASTDLREAMQRAGVLDQPDIYLLTS